MHENFEWYMNDLMLIYYIILEIKTDESSIIGEALYKTKSLGELNMGYLPRLVLGLLYRA